MEATQKSELKALLRAYHVVCELGYTPRSIIAEEDSVNYPTLRRIKAGKAGKVSTDQFYLSLFVRLINEEYEARLKNGGEGSTRLLVMMKDILLEVLGIMVVKR